ncbi:TRAP transporter small permease [Mesobacillus maritimus]|uniref:TRAP transporter small permease subunit n=1 Tax=Mesobacillus maritimus TaxID=1643336 RepID=A0ABS7KAY7_9BACI|nr:TRAP transporter small permease subunit [Mesobacillus maritimus]MBY0099441.1 TRAP transporter small permease subunit [Mesobacillus maritimus]
MKRIEQLYTLFRKLKIFGIVICGISIFLMMFFIVADVVSRNFLSGSLNGSIEFVQYYFMPFAIIPGMAYVYGTSILPRLELLIDKLRGTMRNFVTNALLVLELILFTIVVVYSTSYAFSGVEMASSFSAGGEIYPYYHVLFLVPLTFIFVNLEILFILIRNLHKKRGLFKFYSDEEEQANQV